MTIATFPWNHFTISRLYTPPTEDVRPQDVSAIGPPLTGRASDAIQSKSHDQMKTKSEEKKFAAKPMAGKIDWKKAISCAAKLPSFGSRHLGLLRKR